MTRLGNRPRNPQGGGARAALRADRCVDRNPRRATCEPARAAPRENSQGWDETRLPLFDALFAALHADVPANWPEHQDHSPVFSFYEAYFSNFIEGTEFTVEEAQAIVFEGADSDRPTRRMPTTCSAHSTCISDPTLRSRTPTSADDLRIAPETVACADHDDASRAAPGRVQDHTPTARAILSSSRPFEYMARSVAATSTTRRWRRWLRALRLPDVPDLRGPPVR